MGKEKEEFSVNLITPGEGRGRGGWQYSDFEKSKVRPTFLKKRMRMPRDLCSRASNSRSSLLIITEASKLSYRTVILFVI